MLASDMLQRIEMQWHEGAQVVRSSYWARGER